jgi:S-DNA-T family DNA segregation ATPase FtsK/SpoIIIE
MADVCIFGLMPHSQGWPLPNGLGGVLGDMALKIPATFIGGFPTGIIAVILGLLLLPPALWLLGFGAALIGRPSSVEDGLDDISDDTAHGRGVNVARRDSSWCSCA